MTGSESSNGDRHGHDLLLEDGHAQRACEDGGEVWVRVGDWILAAASAEVSADVAFAGDCLAIGEDGETIYCADATRVGV